jgi:hypothetical protein
MKGKKQVNRAILVIEVSWLLFLSKPSPFLPSFACLAFFNEIMLIGCWNIWNHKNDIIFEGEALCLAECIRAFKHFGHQDAKN